MEERIFQKNNESDLSFTVWTGYDEMIKIEESQDAQDCLEFQRSKRTHYMLNAFSWSNLKGC